MSLERKYAAAQLAGYLSGYKEFTQRHPMELLELAEHCLDGLEKISNVEIRYIFEPIPMPDKIRSE